MDLSRSYANDIAGFSIGYPADWDLQQAADVVSLSHSSGAEVFITFEVLGSVTIQEYASLLAAADGHRQISTTPLHQPPGVLVVGETDIEGMPANVSALIADHFGSAIAIVGLAPRDAGMGVLATVDAIIASASFVTPLSLSVDSHGDEAKTATATALGSTETGAIVEASDVDFFRFEGRRGETVELAVEAMSLTDPFLVLYSQGGECLVTFDDDSAGSLEPRLVWTFQEDSSYFAAVSNADAVGIGRYTLRLAEAPTADTTDDHGNARCSATPLNPGVPVSGSVQEPSDADYFRFEAAAGESFTITVELGTLNGVSVGVFDDESDFALQIADGPGDAPATIMRFIAPATGSYYVDVENADSESTGTYTVSVARAS